MKIYLCKGLDCGKRKVSFAIMLLLTACTSQEIPTPPPVEPPEKEAQVTFLLDVIGSASATRGMSEDADEDLYSADVILYEHGKYLSTINGVDIGDDRFSTNLEKGRTYDMDVIANAPKFIADLRLTQGLDSALVRNALVTSLANYLPETASIMPMWAKVRNLTPITDVSVPVRLLRMMAKADISLSSTAASKLKVTGVYVYRYNKMGSIIPADRDTLSDSPSIPPASFLADMDDKLYIRGSSPTVYLYESANTSDGQPLDYTQRTCLVLAGIYYRDAEGNPNKRDTTYYRLDFATNDGSTKTYFDILRNTHYTFNIPDVISAGSPTPDDAFLSASPNLDASAAMLSWNEQPAGNQSIGTPTLSTSIKGAAYNSSQPATGSFTISTNASWEASVVYNLSTDNDWLHIISPSKGEAGENMEINFSIDSKPTAMYRTAYIRINVGNALIGNIEITQHDFSFVNHLVIGYETPSAAQMIIPSSIGGEAVTGIGSDILKFNAATIADISVPASIKTIDSLAFANCGELTVATFLGARPDMPTNVFSGDAKLLHIYYLPQYADSWQGTVFNNEDGLFGNGLDSITAEPLQ